MHVLIIEDEQPAAEQLERLIRRYDASIQVVGRLDSVAKVKAWFQAPPSAVDLVFMDVQLTDGLSFEAFGEVAIQKPIIFTTAFGEYALRAFQSSGIDYLLKPITFEALSGSLRKLEMIRSSLAPPSTPGQLERLGEALRLLQKPAYKSRFMVRLGDHIHSVTTDAVALFYAVDRDVFLLTNQRRKYIIDYKLEELEELLDPARFFRVNRTFIVGIAAVADVVVYSSSRLLIRLHLDFDREIVVSRERVAPFKEWFNGME